MKSSGRNSIILILLFSLSNVSGASLQELEQSLASLKVRLISLAQKLENTSQASVVDQAQIDKLKREQQRLEEERKRDEESIIKMRAERESRRQKRAQEWKEREALVSSLQKSSEYSKHVNGVIVLDTFEALNVAGPWNQVLGLDVTTQSLIKAIQANCIIISSFEVVVALFLVADSRRTSKSNNSLCNEVVGSIKDATKWSSYITNDVDQNFAVFIPNKFLEKDKSLKDSVSLNDNALSPVNWEADPNIFSYSTYMKKSVDRSSKINIQLLEKLLIVEQSIRKRFYLMGHGTYDLKALAKEKKTEQEAKEKEQVIVGVSHKEYNSLLHHFNKIGCDFLLVMSCFLGGKLHLADVQKTVEKVHRKNRELHEKKLSNSEDLNFILGITSVGDIEGQIYKDADFGDFFARLDNYFDTRKIAQQEQPKIQVQVPYVTTVGFKDILKPIVGPLFLSTPSIKLPGSRTFFRAIGLDDRVEIITYPKLIKRELEKFRIEPGEGIKKPKIARDRKSYELGSQKDIILLYPSIISLPLKIERSSTKEKNKEKANMPLIISMIPGTARHYIEEIQNSEFEELVPFITELFFNYSRLTSREFVSPKAYFIRKIRLKNDKFFENVLVTLGYYDDKKFDKDVAIYCQHAGKSFAVTGKRKEGFVRKLKDMKLILDKTYSGKIVVKKMEEFKPLEGSVYHATGGRETDNQIERKVEKSF